MREIKEKTDIHLKIQVQTVFSATNKKANLHWGTTTEVVFLHILIRPTRATGTKTACDGCIQSLMPILYPHGGLIHFPLWGLQPMRVVCSVEWLTAVFLKQERALAFSCLFSVAYFQLASILISSPYLINFSSCFLKLLNLGLKKLQFWHSILDLIWALLVAFHPFFMCSRHWTLAMGLQDWLRTSPLTQICGFKCRLYHLFVRPGA